MRSPSLPRRTSLSGLPGPRVDRMVSKASCESIAAPSTDTIWSPALTPAREAGELGSTLRTRNPRGRFSSPETRVLPRTPIQTGRTSPKRTRSSTMRRARSIGIAKPIPWAPPMIAVATPIMSPSTLTSGPPELPGLIEASVWMKSVYVRSFSPRTLRPRADTTPAVTVLDSPNGLPMATIGLADHQVGRGTEPDRGQGSAGLPDAQDRQVVVGIRSDDVALELEARPGHRRDLRRARDDVLVGQDDALGVDDRARAERLVGAAPRTGIEAEEEIVEDRGPSPPEGLFGRDVDDRGGDLLDDLDDLALSGRLRRGGGQGGHGAEEDERWGGVSRAGQRTSRGRHSAGDPKEKPR